MDVMEGHKHNVNPPNILDSNSSTFQLRTPSSRTSSPNISDDPTISGTSGAEDRDVIDPEFHPKPFNSGKRIKNYKKKEAALESEIEHREELIELLKERFKKDEEARQRSEEREERFLSILASMALQKDNNNSA
jgi:hypothetical protein